MSIKLAFRILLKKLLEITYLNSSKNIKIEKCKIKLWTNNEKLLL